MNKKDEMLEKVREALRTADNLPFIALPQYLMAEDNVLPGIGTGGQIMTRDELRGLPDDEVLRCRFRYVMLFGPRISKEFMGRSGETKTA